MMRIPEITANLQAQAVFQQALRYLAAAAQDSHPLFGLCHANYARILLEELVRAGGAPVAGPFLTAATKIQDKWSMAILRRFPVTDMPAVQALLNEVRKG